MLDNTGLSEMFIWSGGTLWNHSDFSLCSDFFFFLQDLISCNISMVLGLSPTGRLVFIWNCDAELADRDDTECITIKNAFLLQWHPSIFSHESSICERNRGTCGDRLECKKNKQKKRPNWRNVHKHREPSCVWDWLLTACTGIPQSQAQLQHWPELTWDQLFIILDNNSSRYVYEQELIWNRLSTDSAMSDTHLSEFELVFITRTSKFTNCQRNYAYFKQWTEMCIFHFRALRIWQDWYRDKQIWLDVFKHEIKFGRRFDLRWKRLARVVVQGSAHCWKTQGTFSLD